VREVPKNPVIVGVLHTSRTGSQAKAQAMAQAAKAKAAEAKAAAITGVKAAIPEQIRAEEARLQYNEALRACAKSH
jgi:hypothetical protein